MSKNLLTIALGVIMVSFIGLVVYLFLNNQKLNEQIDNLESQVAHLNGNESDTNDNNSNENDETETDNSSDDSEDNTNEDPETTDMTDLWNLYKNTKYDISLKYPKDMTYTEGDALLTGGWFEAAFKVGSTDVFSVRITQEDAGDTAKEIAERYLANQCTDSFENKTYKTDVLTFAQATEIPMENCMGNTVDTDDPNYIPLEAFALELDNNRFLVFTNYGLNKSQLDAVLSTITIE